MCLVGAQARSVQVFCWRYKLGVYRCFVEVQARGVRVLTHVHAMGVHCTCVWFMYMLGVYTVRVLSSCKI